MSQQMSQQLPSLVDALFERPTLGRLDQLLAALYESPREQPLAGLIDDLLDYRVVLAQSVARRGPVNVVRDFPVQQPEQAEAQRATL